MLCFVIFLTGCSQNTTSDSIDMTGHPLFEIFREAYPEKESFLYLAGDCNDDGTEDLIVVYRESKEENHMVTVYSDGDSFVLTEPINAPVENTVLEWKDIDDKPPIELIVSGQKGIHIGYGVFRFENGEWISLYGDMDGCC